jgi:hypothetical protein
VTWTELQVAETLRSLTADIDTSSAGFLTTPCYSVRFDGERVVEENESVAVVFDSPPNVLEPSPVGFKVNVLVSLSQGDATPWNDWRAVWMGVE